MSFQSLDLKVVYDKTYEARNKWRAFLLQLDVQKHIIDEIGETHGGDLGECLCEGLSVWLRGGKRSWKDVVDALSSPTVDHKNLAKKIEKEYLQSNSNEPAKTKYQIIDNDLKLNPDEHIGSGASGSVFKGLYKNASCAVKVLHRSSASLSLQTSLPPGPGLDKAAKRFDKECQFLKSFKHPNVVEHLTTARHPQSGHNILVTELMDCNLSTYLPSAAGSLSIDGEISISKDIAMGLAYIHSRKIFHRDLCGNNILLKMNQIPLAKISDFGLSRLLDPSTMSHTQTVLHHRDGYMPPEAARLTGEQYDESIDVFSLGVIILQIACRVGNVEGRKERVRLQHEIFRAHPLRGIIDNCLREDNNERLKAVDVGSALKDLRRHTETNSLATTELKPPLNIESEPGPEMPIQMACPQSVVIGEAVYVVDQSSMPGASTVLKFQIGWTKLPERNASNCAITSLNNELVLIGGQEGPTQKASSKIAVFAAELKEWTHPYDPMNTNRYQSTAVSYKGCIIVTGGLGLQNEHLTSMEVFDSSLKTWYMINHLNLPVSITKPAIVGDTLYLMGVGEDYASKVVLKSNLSQLIDMAASNGSSQSEWEQVEHAPLCSSAPVGVGNSLLAIGGRDDNGKDSTAIHFYKPDAKKWIKVGDLPTCIPRYACTCSVLSNGEVIVAGGQNVQNVIEHSVELLSIVNS